ncbi:MAG: SRPBCC domain-containing protein [Bacteroidetes bacterium]|nr:SRPBCC domain-containing protein [Bacteroidota bacterium]
MNLDKITVKALIAADRQKVWNCYTDPAHITGWNFADPSWHCPSASNDLSIGGRYCARMEARDGSFGFDFEAYYTDIHFGEFFSYEFGDRQATVSFLEQDGMTEVRIVFDPETENPVALQQQGWQAILNNFKSYVEEN